MSEVVTDEELRAAAEYVRDNEGFHTGTIRCGEDGDGSILIAERDETFIAHAKLLADYVIDDGDRIPSIPDYLSDDQGRPIVNTDKWPSGMVGNHLLGWCKDCNQFGPIDKDKFSYCHGAESRSFPWTMTFPQFKKELGFA